VYSPRYGVTLAGAAIDPKRSERILSFLIEESLARKRLLHRAPRTSLKALLMAHSEHYLEALRDTASLVPIIGYEPDDIEAQRIIEAQRYGCGGTALACRRALDTGKTTANLGGGFHHATPEGGRGFCVFNDIAVAIRLSRRRGFRGKVLVVDLDLHDGNGTRRAFADDDTVFTFSIHNQSWDDLPATASLSLELGSGVEDETYLAALREHLPPVLAEVEPELVVYVAGVDPAGDDRLGDWRISPQAMLERDRIVVELVRRAGNPPMTIVLAGGYGGEAWRYTARFLAWLVSGQEIEPPPTGRETLARLRQLVPRTTAPANDDGDLFTLTDEDILGSLGESPRRTRLLDYFSPHGLELILERSGIFDRLRAEGYPRPTLDLELNHPIGQGLRVWGEPEQQHLLLETRVLTERQVIPGFELLRIEWLLLQNPRARFPLGRPALPGQTYPGLGLLREVMTLLSLVAEQVQLDGLLFVASHYHLATKGEKYLCFVHADDQAWFEAVDRVARRLPLAAASRGVDNGTLVADEHGEPVVWRPLYMAVPLSQELRDKLQGAEFRAELARARASYNFRAA
jgi:acetoin utilization deacetylase AcuC-like enzyme